MPKRLSKPSREKDVNQLAHQLVQLSTEEDKERPLTKTEISRVMAEMGRKGGKKGGKRRLETLSRDERSEIASKAAKARWAKRQAPDDTKRR